MEIDAGFPGGNVVVEEVRGDEVRLHQDLRDTAGDWFYWCLRLRAAAGRELRFTFTRSRALGTRGPAFSQDQGRTWSWLGARAVEDGSFRFRVPDRAQEVRLSFGMPYQAGHWRVRTAGFDAHPLFSRHRLCTTRKGREVEYVLAGCAAENARFCLVVTCRHHCCEMMAGYALEGLLCWLLDDASPDAAWMREHCACLLVPFVDLDGVEDGDQGKNRVPRDHNRDYEGESIYAATRALRALLPGWSDGRAGVALDLHCPWIAGEHNECIYQVGSSDAGNEREQRRLNALLEDVARGPLPFRAADFLPYGTAWNKGENFSAGKSFAGWAASLPGVLLSSSFEIPYATVQPRAEVNQQTAAAFGADLGLALARYLRAAGTGGD